MSAVSLMYPKKPQEVADDVESIVYILVYFALRFHSHQLSTRIPRGSPPHEVRKINGLNQNLSSLVHQFFWEEFPCEGGYWSGGDRKMVSIRNAQPPVKLKPVPQKDGESRESHLALLLKSLYRLLHTHYSAIKFADLAHFAVEQLQDSNSVRGSSVSPGTMPAEADVVGSSAPKPTMHPVERGGGANSRRAKKKAAQAKAAAAKTAEDQPGLPAADSAVPASDTPQPSARGWRTAAESSDPTSRGNVPGIPENAPPFDPNARRVLDNHDMIIEAFESMLEDDNGKPVFWGTGDKHFDQFDGLKSYIPASDQDPSSGSKRKLESPVELLFGMFAKRVKDERPINVPFKPIRGTQPMELD